MTNEGLRKLEIFLIDGIEKARAQNKIIINDFYHLDNNSCCPLYAACSPFRDNIFSPPKYQEIISKKINETFSTMQLRSFLEGFDSNRELKNIHYIIDKEVFLLGFKLRKKYIKIKDKDVPNAYKDLQWSSLRSFVLDKIRKVSRWMCKGKND